ncbi:alanine racemase [Homoserinimonas sp. OAct 916]|uniref:alanine racemase n=1 Tax=Homoserinimonas sp. OAct 916 TaxID=2211450 RepID=UPI000DBE70D8|nr:alanine racemase [Homoserinimonas sp. OAct 916]
MTPLEVAAGTTTDSAATDTSTAGRAGADAVDTSALEAGSVKSRTFADDGVGAFREAVIDLDAITGNVKHLRSIAGTPHTMAVLKADAYGHGMVEVARAALAGGADWLGVADLNEAHILRQAGLRAPILAWLHDPADDFIRAINDDIDLGISSLAQLGTAAAAARSLGSTASVHFKVDTGLSRNGMPEEKWKQVFEAAQELAEEGVIHVRGIFTHLSLTSVQDDLDAVEVFRRAQRAAAEAGIEPELVHAAATGATLRTPEARFNMVRLGIGIYGVSPFGEQSAHEFGLTQAMTLRGRVAGVKRVSADTGISYGYRYRTTKETTLALVPLGYADGVSRQLSNAGEVLINGERFTISGTVAMDQFVVDVGDKGVEVGDPVVLFGDPTTGAPSADDWATTAGTIGYEIVTRIGARVVRRYVGGEAPIDPDA